MSASISIGNPSDRFRQHRLRIFPPKVARRHDAEAWLDDVGRLSGTPSSHKGQSWSLFHDGHPLGTSSSIDGRIEFRFDDPGPKVLIAQVSSPLGASVYVVQSDLMVVSGEAEELDWLVNHPIDDESDRWFARMMARHAGEMNWRSTFDQILRNHISRAKDPRDEVVRKRSERARYLAFSLHMNLIRKIARQMLGDDEEAIEDAVQAISLKFLTCQGNFDPSRDCGAYLGKMVRHYCLDLKSGRRRLGTLEGDQLSNIQDHRSGVASIDKSDEESVILRLVKEAQNEGVLSGVDAEILGQFVDNMPYGKIAEAFELTSSTEYQARYAAGRRRVGEILNRVRQYVGSHLNGMGESL